jgi:hypothetical protein
VRPYLKKNLSQKGPVEWLKVKALSSNPVPHTQKKKKKERKKKKSNCVNLMIQGSQDLASVWGRRGSTGSGEIRVHALAEGL